MELPLIIDVRTPPEYQSEHVPKAINVPYTEWNGLREIVGEDRTREVWLYCNTGRQSSIVKQQLEDVGYSNIHNYGTIARTYMAIHYRLEQGE